MIESAFVFTGQGHVIQYHLPAGRSSGHIPDSNDLWALLWKHRAILGGVAHTHPGSGPSGPSHTDVTTFSACELGLGKRLLWPIATDTHITFWGWSGPGPHDYYQIHYPPGPELTMLVEGIDRLRELSEMRRA